MLKFFSNFLQLRWTLSSISPAHQPIHPRKVVNQPRKSKVSFQWQNLPPTKCFEWVSVMLSYALISASTQLQFWLSLAQLSLSLFCFNFFIVFGSFGSLRDVLWDFFVWLCQIKKFFLVGRDISINNFSSLTLTFRVTWNASEIIIKIQPCTSWAKGPWISFVNMILSLMPWFKRLTGGKV